MTTELIKCNHLSCHSSSTALGTKIDVLAFPVFYSISSLCFKWRILSRTGKIGSGKNIFPTGLEEHLEDMF